MLDKTSEKYDSDRHHTAILQPLHRRRHDATALKTRSCSSPATACAYAAPKSPKLQNGIPGAPAYPGRVDVCTSPAVRIFPLAARWSLEGAPPTLSRRLNCLCFIGRFEQTRSTQPSVTDVVVEGVLAGTYHLPFLVLLSRSRLSGGGDLYHRPDGAGKAVGGAVGPWSSANHAARMHDGRFREWMMFPVQGCTGPSGRSRPRLNRIYSPFFFLSWLGHTHT
jgi:hypothetical protein